MDEKKRTRESLAQSFRLPERGEGRQGLGANLGGIREETQSEAEGGRRVVMVAGPRSHTSMSGSRRLMMVMQLVVMVMQLMVGTTSNVRIAHLRRRAPLTLSLCKGLGQPSSLCVDIRGVSSQPPSGFVIQPGEKERKKRRRRESRVNNGFFSSIHSRGISRGRVSRCVRERLPPLSLVTSYRKGEGKKRRP